MEDGQADILLVEKQPPQALVLMQESSLLTWEGYTGWFAEKMEERDRSVSLLLAERRRYTEGKKSHGL